MADSRFRAPSIRQEWIRQRQRSFPLDARILRAGVAGAYLPPIRLGVLHETQTEIDESLARCVSMVLRSYGLDTHAERTAWVMQPDGSGRILGERLRHLRAWGVQAQFPDDLQFFRDGTYELNQQMNLQGVQLVYRWEERWLRYIRAALREGVPPILFVDLGRLSPAWRGLRQPQAIVLSGGDGRQAWINDPARTEGPVRVGLSTLMDALLPGEPLAALLRPDARLFEQHRTERCEE